MAGALIGMAAKVLLPDLENVNNAFASVVEHSLPNGIRGLVIAAALAALMSTASAGLLARDHQVLLPDLERQQRLRQCGRAQPAERHPRLGHRRRPGGADVHRQRRLLAASTPSPGPAARARGRGQSATTATWNRIATLLLGLVCSASPWWSAT